MAENVKADLHYNLCKELNDIYRKKNADYGDSFHTTYMEEGFAMARIRLSDKLQRFKSLTNSGEQQVKDESIRDTLMDLANYAIMTVLEMEIDKTCKGFEKKAAFYPDRGIEDPEQTQDSCDLNKTIQSQSIDKARNVARNIDRNFKFFVDGKE